MPATQIQSAPMPHPNQPACFRPTPRRGLRGLGGGFALVITLSLMVLLTLLAVGLLSLSSVALRSSAQGEAMATARANARLALMLALGDLQRAAGPDGRITAPADQAVVKSGPHSGWLGVYQAWAADRGVLARPTPELVRWLASTPTPQAALERDSAAKVATGEVPMVAAGTLGPDPAALVDQVTVPQLLLNQPRTPGTLAWWVADESMKAAAVAGDERPAPAEAAEPLLAANAGICPQTSVLADLGEIPLTDSKRQCYLTNRQLLLKNPAAGRLFHDVTTVSRGLAVDVTRSRFKLDYSLFAQGTRRLAEGLPLYKADGTVNQLTMANGKLVCDAKFRPVGANPLAAFGNTVTQPGINLEELWTYSNLYRNLKWTAGSPQISLMSGSENPSSTDFRHRALADPWFSYGKPVFAAVQFVFSFVSKPSAATAGKFRMLLQMDALVKVWNPNNVKVVIPAGASFAVQLLAVPFQVQWSITNPQGATTDRPQSGLGDNTYGFSRGNWPSSTNKFGQQSFHWLRGNLGGLAAKGASSGYTLEPGECKVFGHDKDTSSAAWSGDPNVNLSPGWGPARQALIVADFGADNLSADDTIEFIVTPDKDAAPTSGSRTYCNKWIGHRAAGAMSQGGNGGLALGGSALPNSIPFASPDPAYFPTVRSSQRLRVSQYVTPKPFMIFGHYLNVEQPSTGTKDAFPNAPRLLTNAAITTRRFRNLAADQLTAFQELWRCDPLPLAYDSPLIDISAQDQGRFGGGHNAVVGVTRCATRQLDAAPPLSLMSLTHAIANGFADRFGQAAERGAMSLDVLQSDGLEGNFKFEAGDIAFSTVTYAAPQVERAIGNSFASPFVRPDAAMGSGNYHAGTGNPVPLFDHSYLANAALFDAWFCSSLHDGRLLPQGAPGVDNRAAAQVLKDFLERAPGDRDARLLNPRVIPAAPPDRAKERLMSGTNMHPDAMARVAAYIYLDGAFNVNSTRKEAWKALLATSRSQAKRATTGKLLANDEVTPFGSSGLAAAAAAKPATQPAEIEQWSGFRTLTDDQLDQLAERIVAEVKRRGPFLSLADFLNRRLKGKGDEQLLGAVQAAIEQAGLNSAFKGGGRSLIAGDFSGLPGAAVATAGGGMARSTGIPGYLMQADVLAAVANQLAPRGDTFRIRGYGSATDAKGRVIAEAWCEAVVQRLPEYLDPLDEAEIASADLKQPLNRVFGRRFAVIGFQWLPRAAV